MGKNFRLCHQNERSSDQEKRVRNLEKDSHRLTAIYSEGTKLFFSFQLARNFVILCCDFEMQMDAFCLLETYFKWHSKTTAVIWMWEFIILWMFFTRVSGRHTYFNSWGIIKDASWTPLTQGQKDIAEDTATGVSPEGHGVWTDNIDLPNTYHNQWWKIEFQNEPAFDTIFQISKTFTLDISEKAAESSHGRDLCTSLHTGRSCVS